MTAYFEELRKWTPARIGLKRAGSSLSTSEVLKFKLAHALARDAVHAEWDYQALHTKLERRGIPSLILRSCISSRDEYLKRPDLGRVLHSSARETLIALPKLEDLRFDLVFVVSDGLSASAIETHFLPFWDILSPGIQELGFRLAPMILVPFSRIAIADSIGEVLDAKISVVLIGERPGLSTVDSLGIYLTYEPRLGRQDSERNCISNIRPPDGLSYEKASSTLLFLLQESLRLKLSGVSLKDDSALIIDSG